MEELRPRIKPQAPASLKRNVLEAVRKEAERSPLPGSPDRRKSLARRRVASLLLSEGAGGRLVGWGAGIRHLHLAAAAAVLLLGIMTFALMPRTSTEERTNTDVVAKAGMRTSTDVMARADMGTSTDMVTKGDNLLHQEAASTSPLLLGGGVRGGGDSKSEIPSYINKVAIAGKSVPTTPNPSSQEEGTRKQRNLIPATNDEQITTTPTEGLIAANTEELIVANTEELIAANTEELIAANTEGLIAANTEELIVANTEGILSTPLPHREGQGGESVGGGLQGGESTLLANLEAHRDLVNACLADELAQARHAWQRVSQVRRQYLQDYEELQQRISEQLQDDINAIGHRDDDTPKEV